MQAQQLIDGLNALGFSSGFVISGDEDAEILEWDNSEEQPSNKDIEAAANRGQYNRIVIEVERERQAAYQLESDPLFFKYQRSEDGVTKAAWLAKVEEIRERYPMPEKPAE